MSPTWTLIAFRVVTPSGTTFPRLRARDSLSNSFKCAKPESRGQILSYFNPVKQAQDQDPEGELSDAGGRTKRGTGPSHHCNPGRSQPIGRMLYQARLAKIIQAYCPPLLKASNSGLRDPAFVGLPSTTNVKQEKRRILATHVRIKSKPRSSKKTLRKSLWISTTHYGVILGRSN